MVYKYCLLNENNFPRHTMYRLMLLSLKFYAPDEIKLRLISFGGNCSMMSIIFKHNFDKLANFSWYVVNSSAHAHVIEYSAHCLHHKSFKGVSFDLCEELFYWESKATCVNVNEKC